MQPKIPAPNFLPELWSEEELKISEEMQMI
jgi:hypothetical protein